MPKNKHHYVSRYYRQPAGLFAPLRPDTVPHGLFFWNRKRPQRALSAKGIQKKFERFAKAAGIKSKLP